MPALDAQRVQNRRQRKVCRVHAATRRRSARTRPRRAAVERAVTSRRRRGAPARLQAASSSLEGPLQGPAAGRSAPHQTSPSPPAATWHAVWAARRRAHGARSGGGARPDTAHSPSPCLAAFHLQRGCWHRERAARIGIILRCAMHRHTCTRCSRRRRGSGSGPPRAYMRLPPPPAQRARRQARQHAGQLQRRHGSHGKAP